MPSYSILDLPEPLRSERLRDLGMTAEEFAAHMAGWQATIAEKMAAAEAAGELDRPQARDDDAADAAVSFVPDS